MKIIIRLVKVLFTVLLIAVAFSLLIPLVYWIITDRNIIEDIIEVAEVVVNKLNKRPHPDGRKSTR